MSSHSFQRPVPVFPGDMNSSSLQKKKMGPFRVPGISSVPKAPPRSCPVSRIRGLQKMVQPPQPISFREDADNSFITDSRTYSGQKKETYFDQCYTIVESLGTGCFGEVHKVINKDDKKTYACKRMHLKYKGTLDRELRVQEVKKLEQLPPHENCVKFYRAWEENHRLYFLTEVCQYNLLEKTCHDGELRPSLVWSYAIDILKGLDHLHKNNLVHMDLKPDNIFIGEDGLCKIGDFGLVIDISKGSPKEGIEGDARYMAPEILQNVYSPAADMFSLGMITLEIATGIKLPSRGPEYHELRNGKLPACAHGLPNNLKLLLTRLLEPNPLKRITAADALQLKFVKRKLLKKRIMDYLYKLGNCMSVVFVPILLFGLYIFSYLFSFQWRRSAYNVSSNERILFDRYESPRPTNNGPPQSKSPPASILKFSDDEDDNLSNDFSNFGLNRQPLNSTPLNNHCTPCIRRTGFPEFEGIHRNGISSVPAKFMYSKYKPYKPRRIFADEDREGPRDTTFRNLLPAFSNIESDEEDLLA